MIEFSVNGRCFQIENIVFDLNGTLGEEGRLSPEVKKLLVELAELVKIYIVTSDTFGTAKSLDVPAEIIALDGKKSASVEKKRWIQRLGADKTAAVGNGYNDHLMLKEAVLGICVIGREGACSLSIETSDIVVTDIRDAISLFLNPKRIVATLRD